MTDHTEQPEQIELQRGKEELRRLIEFIWRSEYYREAPNWKPLDDLPGMISQIDNMFAGVRSQRDEARHALAVEQGKRMGGGEVLKDVTVHLIAAVSLLEKIHADLAPSKKHVLFSTKLADYKASAERGRAALNGERHD